ncbi:GL22462 [Drosophila persimilis]|uniref:GL22462 n=1 Tax=Drosophila persimilis TaxID=7234 RepID=B4H1J7_DROPE|nr:GL22462 [Drosophila persimilis]
MTEVDVVLPEGVAEPTTKLASASSPTRAKADSKESSTEAIELATDDEKAELELEPEPEPKPKPEPEPETETEVETEAEAEPEPAAKEAEEVGSGGKEITKDDVVEASLKALRSRGIDGYGEDSQITSSSSKELKLPEGDEEMDTVEEESSTNGDHESRG